ncbi:MAG: inorganic phosphate transporter [Granulosicoccus sp.]
MSTPLPESKPYTGSLPMPHGKAISPELPRLAISVVFLILAGAFALISFGTSPTALFVALSAVAGGYMAINIGANDVANNVGPAVGSGALKLSGAILIAVVFESAGALLAGGDVVSTISKGIIDASLIPSSLSFMLAMGSALLAGALWLNLATYVGAPVSTTHSIVGGVLGGGVAAAGIGVVNWNVMSAIASSWFISPVLGGLLAAAFLAAIERTVFSREDMIKASRQWVPVFLAVMVAAFSVYLVMKGLKRVWKPSPGMLFVITAASFASAIFILRPMVERSSENLENRRSSVNKLFNIPLIFSAALLSFSHGANDVANAVGPLSAIVSVAGSADVSAKVGIPLWVMVLGAGGISLGLLLFGAKLINTVGKKLTALDQSRAFCVCLSAAITVICASALGLPVSSTHIAIGAVFGVGFYREYRNNSSQRADGTRGEILARISARLFNSDGHTQQPLRKPRKLVRRKHLLTICTAWFVTVPASAAISATLYLLANSVTG